MPEKWWKTSLSQRKIQENTVQGLFNVILQHRAGQQNTAVVHCIPDSSTTEGESPVSMTHSQIGKTKELIPQLFFISFYKYGQQI